MRERACCLTFISTGASGETIREGEELVAIHVMVAVGHSCSRHSSFLPVFHFQVTNVEISETCNTHKNILPLVRQQQEGRREGRATGPSEEGSSERAVRTSHCAFMAVCPVTHCTHLHKFYVNIGKNVTSSNSS